jgi:hypothetical protein
LKFIPGFIAEIRRGEHNGIFDGTKAAVHIEPGQGMLTQIQRTLNSNKQNPHLIRHMLAMVETSGDEKILEIWFKMFVYLQNVLFLFKICFHKK